MCSKCPHTLYYWTKVVDKKGHWGLIKYIKISFRIYSINKWYKFLYLYVLWERSIVMYLFPPFVYLLMLIRFYLDINVIFFFFWNTSQITVIKIYIIYIKYFFSKIYHTSSLWKGTSPWKKFDLLFISFTLTTYFGQYFLR